MIGVQVLGRHAATIGDGLLRFIQGLGQAKIKQFDLLFYVHHHVTRLDITVDEPPSVRVSEPIEHIEGDPSKLAPGSWPSLISEGSTADELHREPRRTGGEVGACRLILCDKAVVVGELRVVLRIFKGQDSGALFDLGFILLRGVELAEHQLYRDRGSVGVVVRGEHPSHTPTTDLFQEDEGA